MFMLLSVPIFDTSGFTGLWNQFMTAVGAATGFGLILFGIFFCVAVAKFIIAKFS